MIDFRTFKRFEPRDLAKIQISEEPQEAADIPVVHIAPVLPEIVTRQLCLVEPHRARSGLAHLGAIGRSQQGCRQAEQLAAVHAAAQFHTVDDVAPLIAAAHLQPGALFLRQVTEVVPLQDHVVEFEEGHRLFALEAQTNRIEAQHPVDGEMRADLLQHFDVAQTAEPVLIVDHDRIGRAVAEGQQSFEDGPDAGDILVDRGVGQHLAAFIAPGRIADPCRAAAHEDNRLVSGLLQTAQHHDLHEAADMQGRRSGVETDVAGHDLFCRQSVEPLGVGYLVDVAALVQQAQEIGCVVAHDDASASS